MKIIYKISVIIIMSLVITDCSYYQLKYINLSEDNTYNKWEPVDPKVTRKSLENNENNKSRFEIIGIVQDINKDEIIFSSKNTKTMLAMGDKVFIIINDIKAYALVTYPMMTLTKCKLIGADKKLINKVRKGALVVK